MSNFDPTYIDENEEIAPIEAEDIANDQSLDNQA